MTLTMRRSDRRDRQLCRFGVMLVVVSLVINMVAVPKAKAVVIDATAAFGAAAATAAINGTTASTLFTGMTTSAATNGIVLYMDAYATATGAAASGTALASTIGAGTIITAAGSLVVVAAAALALIGFIEWLKEDKGIVAGGDSVSLYSSYGFLLADGSIINVGLVDDAMYRGENPGSTVLYEGITYEFSSGYQCYVKSPYFYHKKVGQTSFEKCGFDHFTTGEFVFVKNASSTSVYFMPLNGGSITASGGSTNTSIIGSSVSPDLSLVPIEEIQELPDVIPDGQTMVISPGIAALPQNDPQAAADAIMQTAIDGALNPTVTIEADPTVTPDPDPEPDPDPDGSTETDPEIVPTLPSNLGDLGNALTSRFPFSIPWDIYKAVKLLAAPAKAPYWEIDFMEPIKYRFEDIGDTTITLDFGKPEFEIIGITTRWTSTIGFCLTLAAATKRFVWTA